MGGGLARAASSAPGDVGTGVYGAGLVRARRRDPGSVADARPHSPAGGMLGRRLDFGRRRDRNESRPVGGPVSPSGGQAEGLPLDPGKCRGLRQHSLLAGSHWGQPRWHARVAGVCRSVSDGLRGLAADLERILCLAASDGRAGQRDARPASHPALPGWGRCSRKGWWRYPLAAT